MSLEVIGKVIKLLPEQSGVSTRGEWRKQEFIIETQEQYPKKICISGWGDKVADIQRLEPGMSIKVAINVESREYNERWYTDVRAWKIESNTTDGFDPSAGESFDSAPVNQEAGNDSSSSSSDDEDLPF